MKTNKTHNIIRVDSHGILNLLLLWLLLHGLPFGSAQTGSGSTKPSSPCAPQTDTKFDPTMAILMIVLVSIFFTLGFFSVYIRQCVERSLGTNRGQSVDHGGWLSMRSSARGLDASVIESFPTFLYSTVKGLKLGKEALECAVCLNEFKDDQTLRLIPKCSHVFHPGCIDAWLRAHATCPLCRTYLVPKPGEPVSFQIPDTNTDLIHEPNDNSSVTPVHHHQKRVLGSPDVQLINSVAWNNQNGPPRSRSTGWRLAGLLSPSNSNSNSSVQLGGDLERFTLRLPEEVQSHLALPPQVRSSRRGYRSGSVGGERNYFYYERFEQEAGRLDRRPFSITPPYQTGSLRSPGLVSGSDEACADPRKGLLQTIRSPLDRLFLGKDNKGERPSDRLHPDTRV